MIAVIFESWLKPGKKTAYLDMAAMLMPLVEQVDGFISVERFESVSQPGKMVALSFWRDEKAVWTGATSSNIAAYKLEAASLRSMTTDCEWPMLRVTTA
jgi:heme-degrading monooxygenase HmoA